MRLCAAVIAVAAAVAAGLAGGDAARAALPDSAKLTRGGLGRLKLGIGERKVERIIDRNIRLRGAGNTYACATARLGHGTYGIFTHRRLRRVTLTRRFYQTKSGLRVGLPQSAVRDRYGKRAQRSPHVYVPGGFYFKVTRGNRRLVFETDGERITAISGGRRGEVDLVEGCA